MARIVMTVAISAAALTLASVGALGRQSGNAQEARAMLDKAVAAVKADRDVALEMFNKGEGGFRDGDLYPFCFRAADGKAVATPVYVPAGTNAKTLKDPTCKV